MAGTFYHGRLGTSDICSSPSPVGRIVVLLRDREPGLAISVCSRGAKVQCSNSPAVWVLRTAVKRPKSCFLSRTIIAAMNSSAELDPDQGQNLQKHSLFMATRSPFCQFPIIENLRPGIQAFPY
jgi:hypothetical protein